MAALAAAVSAAIQRSSVAMAAGAAAVLAGLLRSSGGLLALGALWLTQQQA